jgi:hypothetical protein
VGLSHLYFGVVLRHDLKNHLLQVNLRGGGMSSDQSVFSVNYF